MWHRLTSAWARRQASKNSSSKLQQMLWIDYADEVDLYLRQPHIYEDRFSPGAAQRNFLHVEYMCDLHFIFHSVILVVCAHLVARFHFKDLSVGTIWSVNFRPVHCDKPHSDGITREVVLRHIDKNERKIVKAFWKGSK